MSRFLVLLAIFLLLTPQDVSAQERTPTPRPKTVEYVVTAESANLRSGPGTNFSRVGSVSRGDILLIYDETPAVSGWLRIYREGQEDAYIADFLVEKARRGFYPAAQKPVLEISGRGKQITDVYEIPRGLYRIDATVQGRAFILKVATLEGDCEDDLLFNEIDPNSRTLSISNLFASSGCSVIFEIDNVTGSWKIEFRDMLDEEFLSESLLEIEDGTSISGKARSVTMITSLLEAFGTFLPKSMTTLLSWYRKLR